MCRAAPKLLPGRNWTTELESNGSCGSDPSPSSFSELRAARMSQAERHLGAQNCEDVSSETGRTA
eukprot:670222-Pyramimonas_sp.AAC.1